VSSGVALFKVNICQMSGERRMSNTRIQSHRKSRQIAMSLGVALLMIVTAIGLGSPASAAPSKTTPISAQAREAVSPKLTNTQIRLIAMRHIKKSLKTQIPAKDRAQLRAALKRLEKNSAPTARCPWCVAIAAKVAAKVTIVSYAVLNVCTRGRFCSYKVMNWMSGAVILGVEKATWAVGMRVNCSKQKGPGSTIKCIVKGSR
jgi:hypothetical protein